MQALVFATVAVVGGFLVGRMIVGFVDFVTEYLRKQDRDK